MRGADRSPGQNADVIGKAVVFTNHARGFVIVFCGAIAGGCAGYLARRAEEPS